MTLASDASFRRGIELYRAGRAFEAHEAWEEAWLPRRGTKEGELVRALVQLAAACVQLERGRVEGFRSLARAAADRIERALADAGPSERARWSELARALRGHAGEAEPTSAGRPELPPFAAEGA